MEFLKYTQKQNMICTHKGITFTLLKEGSLGVPWWPNALRIQCYHFRGSFDLWPWNFHMPQVWPKERKNLFFSFSATPWHMEVSKPGMGSEPELRSIPQLQQCQIVNPLHHVRNSQKVPIFKWTEQQQIGLLDTTVLFYLFICLFVLKDVTEIGKLTFLLVL